MTARRVIVAGVVVASVLALVALPTPTTAQQKSTPIPYQTGTSRVQFLPDPPAGKITMKFEFWFRNGYGLPAPIQFHQPVGDQNKLWVMESVERGTAVPKGEEIKDGIIFVSPGEQRLITLIFENPLDKPVAFLVNAPTFDPVGAVRHGALRCLCAAFVFAAPPGGAWYRTIAVGVNNVAKPGSKIIVMWPANRLK